MDIPLSNGHIGEMINDLDNSGLNMVNMHDIKKNTNIEDIFNNRGHALIFVKYPNQNIGHWVSMVRNKNNEYIFFDSLGKPLKHYNKDAVECILKNGDLLQNKKKYQSDESSVCGRYAFLLIGLNKLSEGKETSKLLKNVLEGKPKTMSYDEWILHITKDNDTQKY